jgi:hypothetical protein
VKVRLSIEYEVEDDDPEAEELGIEIVRAEADAFAEAVKKHLADAGAKITRFHADYD